MKANAGHWFLEDVTKDPDDLCFEIRTEGGHQNGKLLATVYHQGEETFGNAILMEMSRTLFETVEEVLETETHGGSLEALASALENLRRIRDSIRELDKSLRRVAANRPEYMVQHDSYGFFRVFDGEEALWTADKKIATCFQGGTALVMARKIAQGLGAHVFFVSPKTEILVHVPDERLLKKRRCAFCGTAIRQGFHETQGVCPVCGGPAVGAARLPPGEHLVSVEGKISEDGCSVKTAITPKEEISE